MARSRKRVREDILQVEKEREREKARIFPFSCARAPSTEREAEKLPSRLDRTRIPIGSKKKRREREKKRGRCQRSRRGGRATRWTKEKAVAALYPVFQMESSKPNTNYLSLCAPPTQGESRRRRGTVRRSRQDLKLLSNDWLGARIEACFPIFDPSAACLGNVLFDTRVGAA